MAAILDFLRFFGHKMVKKQNFKNRYFKFVEYHTGKIQSNFKVPNMFADQWSFECTFMKYQYRDLKVLGMLYLQANLDFRKIVT